SVKAAASMPTNIPDSKPIAPDPSGFAYHIQSLKSANVQYMTPTTTAASNHAIRSPVYDICANRGMISSTTMNATNPAPTANPPANPVMMTSTIPNATFISDHPLLI